MEKVYFTKVITENSLINIFDTLNVNLKGKIGIKISTGEKGGHNFLSPELISGLVNKLNGTIIECNTAYPGSRDTSEKHWQTIKEHGFLDIAPCEILDENGEISIPVKNGFRLKENVVGSGIDKYDSIVMLSHFKGHAMGGFGGALKNMSIGLASSKGKLLIHNSGKSDKFDDIFNAEQNSFLESMADACSSVINYKGKENIIYINVLNNLSISCDCEYNPKDPEMKDIGILASTDPVALDQASVDLIFNSTDPKKDSLIERINSRNGTHLIDSAEKLNLGSKEYELINID